MKLNNIVNILTGVLLALFGFLVWLLIAITKEMEL